MLIATIVSTLVIIAVVNYLCGRQKKQGSPASPPPGAPSEPVKAQATTYTVTSALCSVPEEATMAAPRMATGDVPPAEAAVRVAEHDGGGAAPDDKKDAAKEDPEVLSQGEGLQQRPNRGIAAAAPALETSRWTCNDSKIASLDPATNRWLVQKVVALQAMAKGLLLRRSVSELQRRRHAAAACIQAWWRGTRSGRQSGSCDSCDAFFSKYDSVLEEPYYRVYQSGESEVTWSAEETDMLLENTDDFTEAGSDVDTTVSLRSSPNDSEESHLMFGDLMSVTNQSSPLKFADVMATMRGAQGCVKIAEGLHCDVFRVHSPEGVSVLKVLNVEFIVKYWDTLYAEALISLELANLRKWTDYHAAGFLDTKRVFCLLDRYPRELIQAWKDYTSWKRTDHQHGPDELEAVQPYLVLRSSYAGIPLTQAKVETALQLRSVLQQVALSLAVAESALQFEHRDLGLNHVLVNETNFQLAQFCIGGKSFFVNTWGVQATIIDFAAARIKDSATGQIVFSNLSQAHPRDLRHSKVYSIYKEISNITKGNWAGYYPRTNVACLSHITNQLYQVYRSKFMRPGDRKEAEAWSDIHQWRLCLPECRSVSDFVAGKF